MATFGAFAYCPASTLLPRTRLKLLTLSISSVTSNQATLQRSMSELKNSASLNYSKLENSASLNYSSLNAGLTKLEDSTSANFSSVNAGLIELKSFMRESNQELRSLIRDSNQEFRSLIRVRHFFTGLLLLRCSLTFFLWCTRRAPRSRGSASPLMRWCFTVFKQR